MSKTKNKYSLPVNKKACTHILSHPRVHLPPFQHAIDFVLPEGSQIVAAKEGEVVHVKQDSSEGGIDTKYVDEKYVNYITIKHDNGEFSQYVHVKHNGSLVKIGEKVNRGQKIALSGNTGLSSTPHLHFQVFEIVKNKIGWRTLDIRFTSKVNVDRTDYALNETGEKAVAIFKSGVNKLKRKSRIAN